MCVSHPQCLRVKRSGSCCTYVHAHARTYARTHTHMDKLGSCPYGSRIPGEARSLGRHFRDYGPVQNKLLKPGQVTPGALTVAPVSIDVGTRVPPGPPLVCERAHKNGGEEHVTAHPGCGPGGMVGLCLDILFTV